MSEPGDGQGQSPPPWIRLAWSGDVDACSVPPFAAALRAAWEQEPAVLEVDLAGVTFMDGAGLRPLVEAHARLLDRLRLYDPSAAVVRLLNVLGLRDMFLVVGPVRVPERWRAPTRRPAPGATAPVAPDGLGARREPPRPVPLGDRAVIEQARGLLMAEHGCDASSAWDLLRGRAAAHRVGIRAVAEMLVAQAGAGPARTGGAASEVATEGVAARPSRSAPPAD